MENRGFNFIPLAIGAIVILFMLVRGCDEGPFGRQRVVGLSPKEEAALGAQAFQQVLAQERVLPDSDPIVGVVKRIGLAIKSASEDSELREALNLKPMDFQWEFRVVQSKQVNAFCLPGGKVVFYTGILPVCATEAGVATVMGHEVAHALGRHGAERIAHQKMVQIGQTALAVSMSEMEPRQRNMLMALMGAGSQVGILLPFSREHESEADHMGLLLMARAGYDPAAAPEFWQRMDRAGGSRPPQFLSTHPSPATRIQDLRKWQTEAMKFYRKSEKRPDRALPGIGGRSQ